MQKIKNLVLMVLCYLVLPLVSIAQNDAAHLPHSGCGSTDFAGGMANLDEWARAYYAQPQKNAGTLAVRYLPVHLSLLSNTDGTGRMSSNLALNIMCKVNNDYRPYGIQFWLDTLDFSIKNTDFNSPRSASVQDLNPMFPGHKMTDRLNMYFHSGNTQTFVSAAYLGSAQTMPNVGTPDVVCCFAPSLTVIDNTISHTIGHYLGLPHTFSGVEGFLNTPCTTPATQVSTGAPFNDPNCATNGDRFCDTPADYNWEIWSCGAGSAALGNTGNNWSCPLISPDNVTMQIDGSNHMSHSTGLCGNHFSNNQRDRMYSLITTQRGGLLTVPVVGDTISQPAITMTSPLNFSGSSPVQLKWRKVPSATHYVVEVYGNSLFSQRLTDTVVADTSYIYNRVNPTKLNYWLKIKPFNKKYFCTPLTSSRFSMVLATEDNIGGLSTMEVVPNPVSSASFALYITTQKEIKTHLAMMDITGRTIKNFGVQQFPAGDTQFEMDIHEVPNGIYFIKMQNETGVATQKIVVLH